MSVASRRSFHGVSRGGFYGWLTRPRSAREISNEEVARKVRTSFLASDRQTIASEPDVVEKRYLHIPDRFVQSIQVDVEIARGWDVYAGIDNIFYQKTSIGENTLPVDPLGRFFYVGVKADLDFDGHGL